MSIEKVNDCSHISPIRAIAGIEAMHSGSKEAFLFIASKGSVSIKRLDLATLDRGQRIAKLNKFRQEERFVLVVLNTDGTYSAHAKQSIAASLAKQQNLSINGHAVIVKQLSDEEYERLDFLGKLLIDSEEGTKETSKDSKEPLASENKAKQARAVKYQMTDETFTSVHTGQIKLLSSELITKLVQEYDEQLRAERKRQEEIEKSTRILHTENDKQRLKKEAVTQEIKAAL